MEWTRLRSFRSLPEAHLALEALQRAGLHAKLRGIARSGLAGEIPLPDARIELWVLPAQLVACAALLAEIDAVPEGPARACPACGEENPPAFELCWSCGAMLEGAPEPG